MTTFLLFFALLLGSALTFAGLWLFVRRAMRQLDVAETYREVAQQLGLTVDTRGVSIRGYLADRRMWLGEVLEGFGTDRRTEIRGIVGFHRPLGVGLAVRRRRWTERWRRARVEVGTGEPGLDQAIAVQCDDPAALRALFTPDVQAALASLVAASIDLVVNDDEIQVWLAESPASPAELSGWIERLLRAADAIEKSRAAFPAPNALDPVVLRWEALAADLGLELLPEFPAVAGGYSGHRVEIVARRELSGYAAMLVLRFRSHPELGLLLRPQREPDGYWNVGQDIQLGDPAFDPAFVVKGWDPAAVRHRLNADARSAILALAARGSLVIDDRAITLRGLGLDPADVRAGLREAAEIAAAIGW